VSVSVVIPAHNESAVIANCLRELLRGGEGLEVIVVCNGCTDSTAQIVRSLRSKVRVIESSIPSKTEAMNLGTEAASGSVVIFQDADVLLTGEAASRLAAAVEGGGAMAAAPAVEMVYLPGTRWSVRAYYALWLSLPYVREGMMAAGVYAVGSAGRARIGRLPRVIADDGYVRLLFSDSERIEVADAVSRVMAPRRLRDLIKIKTRSRLGWYELRLKHPERFRAEVRERAYGTAAAWLFSRPRLWLALVPYAYVNVVSRLRARRQLARLGQYIWERDESTRLPGLVGAEI
jgi:glycosyltransferase involved in cell wall biosynthesis